MNAEEHVQAMEAVERLLEVVEALRDEMMFGDVELPPRAIPIITGSTETIHALTMGGWPWMNPALKKLETGM